MTAQPLADRSKRAVAMRASALAGATSSEPSAHAVRCLVSMADVGNIPTESPVFCPRQPLHKATQCPRLARLHDQTFSDTRKSTRFMVNQATPHGCAAARAVREKLNSRRISGTACNVVGMKCLYCLTHLSGCLTLKVRHGKPYAAGVAARLMVLPVVSDLFLRVKATTPPT